MANEVSFYLNGEAVGIDNPSPDLMLIDYLRAPDVSLAGPKKGCGQGGCGSCTVILSQWNPLTRKPEHRAINSCLRPVCALGGMVVTTIEGTGAASRPPPKSVAHARTIGRGGILFEDPQPPSVEEVQLHIDAKRAITHKNTVRTLRKQTGAPLAKSKRLIESHPSNQQPHGMNPVAHRLAINNGTQCGYCSVGFVMNMSEFLVNNPGATKKDIEEALDGNICRCTGYRSILTGMKTFASDWSEEDEKHRMNCLPDLECSLQQPGAIVIPFPKPAEGPLQPVDVDEGGVTWLTPTTIDEACSILRDNPDARFVHANTSYGVYRQEYEASTLLVDIRLISELYDRHIGTDEIVIGGGTSYTDLIGMLKQAMDGWKAANTGRAGAVHFMARRTAGRIVRNAASIAGNSMLVLKHINDGAPFASDIMTALDAIGAEVEFINVGTGKTERRSVNELVAAAVENPHLADQILLLRYYIARSEAGEINLAQKTALREVNSHAIVNAATRFHLAKNLTVEKAVITFGGIAPHPWRPEKTISQLEGSKLSLEHFSSLAQILRAEIKAQTAAWSKRMSGVVYEGVSDEYRTDLAIGFLYKAIVNALNHKAPKQVPRDVISSGEVTWGRWPVSDGRQYFKTQSFKQPVSEPYIKLMAMYQASGQVRYTHEYEVPPLTVNAAFVQSARALADFHFQLPGSAKAASAQNLRDFLSEKYPCFVDLVTCEEVQKKDGRVNYQGMAGDQPLFSDGRVSYVGQSIALVLADSELDAIAIANFVSQNCVGYSPVKWSGRWKKPVLDLLDAIKINSVFPDSPRQASFVTHIWRITRPGSQMGWARPNKTPWERGIVWREDVNIQGSRCDVVENTQQTGGQIHFYLETQSCVVEPAEANRLIVHPSSQSPMEMHHTTALALGMEYNQIEVKIRQVGGGYGGKTEQARFVAGPTAVAAQTIGRPVRLVMPRDEDTAMIGKRHAYYASYQIAVDRGDTRPDDKGIIRGMQIKMWGDGGAFYDCSYIVSNCIQTRADNAYMIANFETQIDVCRTNKAPSTAFRSFGDIQGKVMQENAIDDAAHCVGMHGEALREKNLYIRGDVTPFGQALSYCYMREVWAYLKEKSQSEKKREEIDSFNKKNKWRKRGLAMIPVKYGSGYNLVMLEQASAVVAIYSGDGSIIIHQGGVDMGQGLKTKVEQVAAYILNVPMSLIHVEGPNIAVTPNPSSTGGSTGTAYNGEAVKQTCEQLRARLTEFGYQMLKEKGDDWCKANGIDFWNYGEQGWQSEIPKPPPGKAKMVWQNLVHLAYSERVSLTQAFNAKIPGGTVPMPNIEYKPRKDQPRIPGIDNDYDKYMKKDQEITGAFDSFVGFTYSAACSVIELDVLTGEVKILSSDIVFDMGWSLNPAIDIGQVEGAFVQGVGYVLTEELVFQPDGPQKGRLNTVNTWRYKPPATPTIPLQMNVHLFPRDWGKAGQVPENPNGLLSSKEVGEPPLVLASSVFFAVKDAIRASRLERGLDGLFHFDAPATVHEVRRACQVSDQDLVV
jgi:xanthine dehydrogenase/oxidase